MAELAIPPRVEDFATVLAVKLREAIVSWRKFGSQPVFTEFVEESIHAPGSPVTVHDTDGSHIEGTFAGLDETDGALRLRLADGSERVIRAGDVS